MTLMPILLTLLVALAFLFVWRAWTHLKEARSFIAQVRRQNCPSTVSLDWTQQEAIIWRTFLSNPTGQILLKRARSMESINAIKGANDVFHTQHSAGRTAGFSDAINWLESLASEQLINSLSQEPAIQVQMTADGQQDGAVPVDFKSS